MARHDGRRFLLQTLGCCDPDVSSANALIHAAVSKPCPPAKPANPVPLGLVVAASSISRPWLATLRSPSRGKRLHAWRPVAAQPTGARLRLCFTRPCPPPPERRDHHRHARILHQRAPPRSWGPKAIVTILGRIRTAFLLSSSMSQGVAMVRGARPCLPTAACTLHHAC